MKLVQFYLPKKGKRVGVVIREDEVIDITTDEAPGVLALLEICYKEHVSLNALVADKTEEAGNQTERGVPDRYQLASLNVTPNSSKAHLLMPIEPPEVWGCGVTYLRSAQMRDEDAKEDIYGRVYNSPRPEIFFKATKSRCVGPNDYICIRSDSNLTATEPELAYVLGQGSDIVGYTICNDVSAWDIERENPLYLPQSKIFYGCCALGPMLATPSELDPYNLNIKCAIIRDGKTIYEGRVLSSQIKRRFEELTEYLCRDNPIPMGAVVSTGTGIIVPNDLPLAHGDIVEIEIEGLGKLSNPVKKLGG